MPNAPDSLASSAAVGLLSPRSILWIIARDTPAATVCAALQSLRKLDGNSVYEVRLQLAVAEARYAVGSVETAHEALREALRQLRLRANLIPDPNQRERFLCDGPDSAQVLLLASSWLGEML